MSRLLRLAAATGAVVTPLVAFHGVASAHSNAVTCVDQATSTWRITNDYPLSESFTSPQGPSGNVAAGNGSYTDVVYVGDSLQIDATWTDGFTESRTGTGDCTPEQQETTTTTELVTTTTEQETTTSTTTTPTSTTLAVTTTVGTTTVPASSTTTLPSTTSSSVATTSTTSVVPSSPAPSTSTPSTTTPAPSSTTPECSDNQNTPTDDCAPICQPVTQPDGSNSCYRLPATGADVGWLIPAATLMILCGATTVICGRRR